jgi:hypothetical protein
MGPVLDGISQEEVLRLLSIAQESVFSGHTGPVCIEITTVMTSLKAPIFLLPTCSSGFESLETI